MLIRHFIIFSISSFWHYFCVLNMPFQIKWLMNTGFSRNNTNLSNSRVFSYYCEIIMSLPREQSIFAWCFITPFPVAVKCCWKLIFSSVFWSLSGQKDQPKFSKMLRVQQFIALPFVPYAKIKLICVVLKSDTAPWTSACCFLSSLYIVCPIFALSWRFTKVSFCSETFFWENI